MSVFDDNLNTERIDKESDKLILQNYKVSNSGATLIPKVDTFALPKEDMKNPWRTNITKPRVSKIPNGIFKEESSIFKIFCANKTPEQIDNIYPIYLDIIRGMGLNCLVYNQKRYYQINRETKRKIAYILFKNINNTNNDK